MQKNTCNVIQIEESYQKQLFAFTSNTTFIGLLTIIGNFPVLETNRYNKRDYQLQTPGTSTVSIHTNRNIVLPRGKYFGPNIKDY